MDSVKSDGERGLPKDGTVHQITSNALIFTEQLIDFAPTLAPILQRDITLTSALNNLPRNLDASFQAKALLGAYVSEYRKISCLLAEISVFIAKRSNKVY